jgi:hypothetical protein
MWEDASPPAFRFSDDGSVAWVARDVRSSRRLHEAQGARGGLTAGGGGRAGGAGRGADATAGGEAEGALEAFPYEQTSTFQKQDGAWVMTSRTIVPGR